jgi:adenylate cyclase
MPVKLNRLICATHRGKLNEDLKLAKLRVNRLANALIAPKLENLNIGAGRKANACVIFFDIRGFTKLSNSDHIESLQRTLLILDCVIPAMMRVLFRADAYVEKNTGDGLMAILGIETDDQITANKALDVAEEMMYVLHHVVNPALNKEGLQSIDARIGMDMGPILIARIGCPTGSSGHNRNTLTAVGPAANRACKLQGLAGTNEIWCGDAIYRAAYAQRVNLFKCVTPPLVDWDWIYGQNADHRYHCWSYNGVADDFSVNLLAGSHPLLR